MKQKNKDNTDNHDYFYADGTKSHTQEKNMYKNDIKVAITTNDQGEKVLLSCNVNKSWEKLNEEINELNILKSDATLISDGEVELKNTLSQDDRKYQLDYIHFIRDISYKLWSDHNLDIDTRKKIKKYGEEIIYKLKNQTIKYSDNPETLKKKINEAVNKLKEFSQNLQDLGCNKTAKFVKKIF